MSNIFSKRFVQIWGLDLLTTGILLGMYVMWGIMK